MARTNPLTARTLSKQLLDALAGPTPAAKYHARYIGAQGHEARAPDEQSALLFWGHKAAAVRDASRRADQLLRHHPLTPAREFQLWRSVWDASDLFELKAIALGLMTSKRLRPHWMTNSRLVFDLAPEIDNWALSDSLSDTLAQILENDPQLLRVFQKWNSSQNAWLRRQSIVGLYCYARMRKRPLPVRHSLPLVKNLLKDPHFYVQRGVGWTLREIDRVDSAAQRKFVQTYLPFISPVAWFAASELYPAKLRTALVHSRKLDRSNSRRSARQT